MWELEHPLVCKLLPVMWRAERTAADKVLDRKKAKMQIVWVSLGCRIMKYSLLGWFNIFLVWSLVCVDNCSVSHLFLSGCNFGSYCQKIRAMDLLQVRPFLICICRNDNSMGSNPPRTWITSCSFLNDLENLDLTPSHNIWRMLW